MRPPWSVTVLLPGETVARERSFNIAYAKSSAGASDQGAIVLYPRSTHQGDTITEHETPSTSWVEPWRLPPSAPALAVTMRLLQGGSTSSTAATISSRTTECRRPPARTS